MRRFSSRMGQDVRLCLPLLLLLTCLVLLALITPRAQARVATDEAKVTPAQSSAALAEAAVAHGRMVSWPAPRGISLVSNATSRAAPTASPSSLRATPIQTTTYAYVATRGDGLYRSANFTYDSGDPV